MRRTLTLLLALGMCWGVQAAPDSGATEGDAWGGDAWGDDSWSEEESGPALHGFYETALGGRLQDDPALAEDKTLAELRSHFEWERGFGSAHYSLKGDLYADGVEDGLQLDLREAMVQLTPLDWLDLQAGQQVSTWGTGDMLFLNDLFPKDWKSFFAGRDETYLKAPAASIKSSLYADSFSLDLIWTPLFEPDRYIDGERFSYFSPVSGRQMAAPDAVIDADEPDRFPEDGELAARLYGRQGSLEWALYGYRGFWKQPNGLNSVGEPIFPRLDVFGASLRAPLAGGIANSEIAWYEGRDERGDDPLIPNDQLRWLAGYEHELVPKLTGSMQYYVEWMQDYDELKRSSPAQYRPDELRQVVTLRLTWRLMRDNLTLSWFNYWSPTDEDYYLRPSISYRLDDNWTLSTGANLFGGEQEHTFFGQFEEGSNLWARVRYGF
ncbi:hypothetical protein GCM10011352_14850 [Marinobacterium zhoushanense]|uniref:Uncharacterized protein n=1 Tax=Marinobacterium zhoushanense TaxID=1679163 RepID=A0ABQ1K787_9GAMM|nr:hypothetical protein [Marinobacterium zhoushanense]GGB89850.1 hypothetical protein GCM10011352_14850 [Marinobacterium zhoushanense]